MTRSGNTTQRFDHVSASRRLVVLAGAAMLAGFGGAVASAATIIHQRQAACTTH